MQDMLLKQDSNGVFDLQIDGNDFTSAYGFETAIVVSFFTDARASSVQVQEAMNRRGWAGNILTRDLERELGGMLWLLDQARLTTDILNFARTYAQGSLQWMLEDDIGKQIIITVEKLGDRKININTDITTMNDTVKRYSTLWRNTNFNRITT